jgi:hypothetical protein
LLALPTEELDFYEPKNVAEELALRQIQAARGVHNITNASGDVVSDITLPAVREITDRTEGKAAQTVTVNTDDDQDRMRLASQALAVDIVALLTKVKDRQDHEAMKRGAMDAIDITPDKVTDITVIDR